MDNTVQNYYRVEKLESKIDRWIGYGSLPEEDVKAVIKGYKKNSDLSDMFYSEYYKDNEGDEDLTGVYTRKGTGNMFTVEFDYGLCEDIPFERF